MFKIFINDGKSAPPDDDIFYILGKDGLYLRKKLGRIDAIIPVDKISILGDVKPAAKYDLPKIPKQMFAKIIAFFKKIYEDHHSEAIVLLHFNEETEKFKLQIPHQKVTAGGINYLRTVTYPGYTKVCTIHSHSSMSAFHSGVDDKDEEDTDGLHITVGHLDWENWSFDLSVSVVFNGKRFMAEADDYIEGLTQMQHEVTPSYFGWYSAYFSKYQKEPKYKPGYVIDIPESKMTFDKRWLDYVTVQSRYRYFSSIYSTHKTHNSHYSRNQEIIDKYKLNSDDTPLNLDVEEEEWEYNPCENCVFSEYKLLQEIEDDDLDIEDFEGLTFAGGCEHNYRPVTHPSQKSEKGGE